MKRVGNKPKPKGTRLQVQMAAFRKAFDEFDLDGSGSIDGEELTAAMRSLGEDPTPETVARLIDAVDADSSGSIDFEEFVVMMRSYLTAGARGVIDRRTIEDGKKVNVKSILNAFENFRADEGTSVYRADGDPGMDTPKMRRRRLKLRQHEKVVYLLEHCWNKLTTKKGRDNIPRDQYIAYMINVCKVIWDEQDFTVAKATASAEEDWEREMGPHAACWFDKELFFDSLFELVDIWAAGTKVDEYLYYLQVIVDRVFYSGKKWPEHFRGNLRAMEHVTSVQHHAMDTDADGNEFSAIWLDQPQPMSVVFGAGSLDSQVSSIQASDFDSLKQSTTFDAAEAAAAAVADNQNEDGNTRTRPPWQNIRERGGKAGLFKQTKLRAPRSFVPHVGEFTWQMPTAPGDSAPLNAKTSPLRQSRMRSFSDVRTYDPKGDRKFHPPRKRVVRSLIEGVQASLTPRDQTVSIIGGSAFAGVASYPQSYAPCPRVEVVKSREELPTIDDQSVASKIEVVLPGHEGPEPSPQQATADAPRPRPPLHEPKYPPKQLKYNSMPVGPTEGSTALNALMKVPRKNTTMTTVSFQVAEHKKGRSDVPLLTMNVPDLSAYAYDVRAIGNDKTATVTRGSGIVSDSRMLPSPPKASRELYSFRGIAGSNDGGSRDVGVSDGEGQGSLKSTSHLQLVLSPQQDDQKVRNLRLTQMHRDKHGDSQHEKYAIEATAHRIPTAE